MRQMMGKYMRTETSFVQLWRRSSSLKEPAAHPATAQSVGWSSIKFEGARRPSCRSTFYIVPASLASSLGRRDATSHRTPLTRPAPPPHPPAYLPLRTRTEPPHKCNRWHPSSFLIPHLLH
eukprot:6212369-Pleurochrysis_carterae.AAC.6